MAATETMNSEFGERNEPQRRAIAAARELAKEGGYDAVQIRDVVARSGLSSATIYRHFSSRDHLIAAAQLEWNRTLPRSRRKLAADATAVDRVIALLHQTCVSLGRSPNLGKALVFALGSPDPGVRACRAESDRLITDTLRDAIGDELEDPDEVVMPLCFAWQGALFSWAHDQLSIREMDQLLATTARLLLAGVSAPTTGRVSAAPTRRRRAAPGR